MNNFFTLAAIIRGLQTQSVDHLQYTKERLPKDALWVPLLLLLLILLL